MPSFTDGKTDVLLRQGPSAGRPFGEILDWTNFYVGSFADRDIFMCYYPGGGLGHSCNGVASDSLQISQDTEEHELEDQPIHNTLNEELSNLRKRNLDLQPELSDHEGDIDNDDDGDDDDDVGNDEADNDNGSESESDDSQDSSTGGSEDGEVDDDIGEIDEENMDYDDEEDVEDDGFAAY